MANQIDFSCIEKELAIDIVCDYMHLNPGGAVTLLEKISGQKLNNQGNLDWAFAKLSVEMAKNTQIDDEQLELIKSRIINPGARRFSSEASLVLRNYTGKQVLDEIEKLNSVGDKLYLICQWCSIDRAQPNAEQVLRPALQLAISSLDYTPNASIYRDLAKQFKWLPDSVVQEFITAIDAQKQAINLAGPTEAITELELIIASSEYKWDNNKAFNRILNIYVYIDTVTDLSLRTSCLAHLLIDSRKIFISNTPEEQDTLSMLEDDFRESLLHLLSCTADHLTEIQTTLNKIAKHDINLRLK